MRFFIPDIESFAQEQPLLYEVLYNVQSVLSGLPVYGGNGAPEGTIQANPNSVYFQADAANSTVNTFVKGQPTGNPPNLSTGWKQVWSLNAITIPNPSPTLPATSGGFNPNDPGVLLGANPPRVVTVPPQQFPVTPDKPTNIYIQAFGIQNNFGFYDHQDFSAVSMRERWDIGNLRRGILGTPAVQFEAFVNGAAQNFRATGTNDIRMSLHATGGGQATYSWASGQSAAGYLNSIHEGVSARTYLSTGPNWGFYGSPSYAGLTSGIVQQFGSPNVVQADSSGLYSPGHVASDIQVSGRTFFLTSGGYPGLGLYGMADITANAARTFLNSLPRMSFFGSPASGVNFGVYATAADVVGVIQARGTAGSAGFNAWDNAVGGFEGRFDSGDSTIGHIHIQRGGTQRYYLNSTGHGFEGTAGFGLDYLGSNTSALHILTNGSGPWAYRYEDSSVGGSINAGYHSGSGQFEVGGTSTIGTVQKYNAQLWGLYGTPTHGLQQYGATEQGANLNGAGAGLVYEDTQVSGVIYGLASGVAANGGPGWFGINQTGAAARINMSTTPQWGFFGSPNAKVSGFTSGQSGFGTSGTSVGLFTNDTQASGRQYSYGSGFNLAGFGQIQDVSAGAVRTYLSTTPGWGFYGSTTDDVHVFGQGQVMTEGATAAFYYKDRTLTTNHALYASGGTYRNWTSSGSDQTTASDGKWGFYGSPGQPLELFAGGSATFRTVGAAPSDRVENTNASGRAYDFASGIISAALFSLFDATGSAHRWRMDGSGNADLFGATPVSGFLTGAGGKIADSSGNLVLKNIAQGVPTTTGPTTASGTYAVIPEMTVTLTTAGNKVLILFTGGMNFQTYVGTQTGKIAIFKDGAQLSDDYEFGLSVGGANNFSVEFPFAVAYIDSPTAASHTYDIRWLSLNGGTLHNLNKGRRLQVTELG